MKQRCRPVSFLASVTSEVEAQTCVALGADIIDAKNPATGALGALPAAKVRAIFESVSGRVPVSATIGDLPTDPELVSTAVCATAATGVDIVKIGFWPGGDGQATLQRLSNLALGRVALVGVLLADQGLELDLMRPMAEAGFAGVMLDTADKASGALPDVLSASVLTQFIETAHGYGMFAGLAGSLRVRHVPELVRLGADLLGFRGGLCRDGQRSDMIDADAVRRVRDAIPLAKLTSAQPCFQVGDGGIAPTQLERTL
jgi:uncharacterized protein (UPF0264 family)